jgi:hypothetical protein
MVGLICKTLLDLVKASGGDDAVKEVRQMAEVPQDRDYKLNVVYDDTEWRRLVGATCQVLAITPDQAEEAFADFFLMCKDSREFLLRQPAIHNSLAAGVTDESRRSAVADKFRIETTDDGIVTHYRSENGHCGLYRALARRIIDHYGDEATIEEPRCARRGDSECEIHVRWTKFGARP